LITRVPDIPTEPSLIMGRFGGANPLAFVERTLNLVHPGDIGLKAPEVAAGDGTSVSGVHR
jgi:hypothetical protein